MKTKLGISAGLMGALICLIALFSGYLGLILLVGYVLLVENNEWLRKLAVKVFAILVAFSLVSALVGFLPDLLGLINDLTAFAEESIYGSEFVAFLTNLVSLINTVLAIAKKVILLVLAALALGQKTLNLGPIDAFINKHMKAE